MAEERVQRRLAAILAADVVGYSRLMGEDEEGTRARFNAHLNELIEPAIANQRGRIVKTVGDGLLVEFASVVDAVGCAVEIQKGMVERNSEEPGDRCMEFRIGVNLGEVIIEGNDIHGDGVNVASRLEGLCAPNEVYVSGMVYEQVVGKLAASFEDMGEQTVKNIAKPVRVYRTWVQPVEAANVIDVAEPLPLPDKPSIAVLPFDNMSADPEQEFFTDGICEDIISELSKVAGILVIARNSSFTYKGRSVKVQQVGRELGVRFVLEGSVRKVGNRVRITAQLIESKTEHHLWSEHYDRDLDDIFALQSEVAQKVTEALEVTFKTTVGGSGQSRSDPKIDAYELYVRARSAWSPPLKANALRARNMCEEVIQRDPEFAGGYAGLAYTLCLAVGHNFSESSVDDLAKATLVSERAIALDDSFGPSNTVFAYIHLIKRNYDQAIWFGERAIRIQPSDAFTHGWLGYLLVWAGMPERGRDELDQAIRLDPLHPTYLLWRGFVAYELRDYADTIRLITEANKLGYADYHYTLSFKTAAYSRLGDDAHARAGARQILEMYPGFTISTWGKALFRYKEPEEFQHLTDALVAAGINK